jgi:hypothetical protein
LDPAYEKIERVDLPDGDNPVMIVHNDADLKTLTIYKKQLTDTSHSCLNNNGGCEQICLPSTGGTRICACGMQYRKVGEMNCESYKTFLVVTQLDVARGYSFKVLYIFYLKKVNNLNEFLFQRYYPKENIYRFCYIHILRFRYIIQI